MNHPVSQNRILDVVMSLNTDQRVDVLNYVSKVQKKVNVNIEYKQEAMEQIKQALEEVSLF